MRGKAKRRSNIFKLGRRGRPGRVAFDKRWSVVKDRHNRPTERISASAEASRDAGSPSRGAETINPTEKLDFPETDGALVAVNSIPATDLIRDTNVASLPTNDHEETFIEVTKRDGDTRNLTSGDRREGERTLLDILDMTALNEGCTDVADEGLQTDAVEGITTEFDDEENICNEDMDTHHHVLETLDNVHADEIPQEQVDHPECGSVDDTGRNEICSWSGSAMITGLKKPSTWQNLLSLLVVTGSVRFSVVEYEVFRGCMNALMHKGFPDEQKLPAHTTISRTLLPLASRWGFVPSVICTAGLDSTKAGARRSEIGFEEFGKFKVVMPSSRTAADVSCPQTWKLLKDASQNAEYSNDTSCFQTIEGTPMLRDRKAVLDVLPTCMDPSSEEYRCDLLTCPNPRDVMWTVRLETPLTLPGDLCASMDINEGDPEFPSVTMKPLRTVLVFSSNIGSEMTAAKRTNVALGSLPHLGMEGTGLWYAGVYCTALQPKAGVNSLLVLVHHQAKPGRLSERFELIGIPYTVQHQGEGECCTLSWRQCWKNSVSCMSVLRQDTSSIHTSLRCDDRNSPIFRSYGRLQNGMKYFVDHILLYSDGFSQYQFKQGSAGGVYCVSLNYPSHLRRSRESVRVLPLTPPGVSTTEGLRSLITDLVHTSTEGRIVRNADGESMVIFTDVVGFVCDYHEISTVLDVIGHTGRATCHLCSFLRYKGHHSSASQYAFSTKIHGCDACYARSAPRTAAIRATSITDKMLVILGLKKKGDATYNPSPLVEYYEALSEKPQTCSIPLTDCNRPVLNPRFDPYRYVLVAPDHLLAGIAINEMTLAFKVLPSLKRRTQADRMICQSLRSNGLIQQSEVFNSATSTLHSTSISGTFCILLIADPVFAEMTQNLLCPDELTEDEKAFTRRVIKNLGNFRRLVSRTYWYPRSHVDEPNSFSAFNSNSGIDHISSLQDLCIDYMSECNEICKESFLASRELDKPNLHRLLELYFHSIPAMGNVQHFSELLFECAHQPLKRAMANSNFRDSHIQSMTHSIGDDWKARLHAAFAENDGGIKQQMESVVNILCGAQNQVRAFVSEKEDLKDRITSLIQNEFMELKVGRVPIHMDWRQVSTTWRLTDRSDDDICHADVERLIRDFLFDSDPESVKVYVRAKRIKIRSSDNSDSASPSRPYDTLSTGHVVQALLDEDFFPVLHPGGINSFQEVERSSIFYFAVEELLGVSNHCAYAAVRKCNVTDGGLLVVQENSERQLLKLNDSVRRICVVHACHRDPNLRCIQPTIGAASCEASVLNGHLYYFYNRENGYPPRMA